MDANVIFKNILNHIESSPLNFMVNKTPFSATISLKSSFAKRYDDVSTHENHAAEENVKNSLVDIPSIKMSVLENAKLKAKVIDLEKASLEEQNSYKLDMKALVKERDNFEKLYEQGKTKLKVAEDQIASLREDLIVVKKEKNKASLSVKRLEEEHEQTNQDNINMKEEISNNSNMFKVQSSEVDLNTGQPNLRLTVPH